MRHGGKGHGETLHAAVGLGHLNLQVTAVGRAVKVCDFKRAGRHHGFVDDRAKLADRHARVGLRNTTYNRRVAALGIGQHPLVAADVGAAIVDAVENVAVGGEVTQRELRFQLWHGALNVGTPRTVVRAGAAGVRKIAVVTEAPCAHVRASIEHHAGGVVAATPAAVQAQVVGAVAHARGGDAVVPKLRAHPPARIACQISLRNTDVEHLLTGIKADGGVGNVVGQGIAERLFRQRAQPCYLARLLRHHPPCFHTRGVQAKQVYQLGRQADGGAAVIHGAHFHITTANSRAVDSDVGTVDARQHVALLETIQINLLRGFAVQEVAVELNGLRCHRSRRQQQRGHHRLSQLASSQPDEGQR